MKFFGDSPPLPSWGEVGSWGGSDPIGGVKVVE